MRLVLLPLLCALGAAGGAGLAEWSGAANAADRERSVSAPAAVEPVAEAPKAPARSAEVDLGEVPAVSDWLPDERRCARYRRRRGRCNGPRRAPVPSGKPSRVATALGLGTHRAAAALIRGEPRPEWVAAAQRIGKPRFPLAWPIADGRFGRGYGRGRAAGGPRHHRGVDVTAEVGTPVRAVERALVGYADNTVHGYGNLLVLLHGDGSVSAYAHLSAIHVFAGQVVERGQPVALAGNTGISRGPHLHFEWREGGQPVDPMPRFDRERWPEWMQRAHPEPADEGAAK